MFQDAYPALKDAIDMYLNNMNLAIRRAQFGHFLAVRRSMISRFTAILQSLE